MANLTLCGYFLVGLLLFRFHRPRNTRALKSQWLLAKENSVLDWEEGGEKEKKINSELIVCFLGTGRANDSGSAMGFYVSAEKTQKIFSKFI